MSGIFDSRDSYRHPEVNDAFEAELIDALQPIRGLALAHAVWAALQSGILQVLASGPTNLESLSQATGTDSVRLEDLLIFLRNESVVELGEDGWRATARGCSFIRAEPWYQMLVGGYAQTFAQLRDGLEGGEAYLGRNSGLVGQGSCGISQYDAIPMLSKLLQTTAQVSADVTLIDLGCGDASSIADLCDRFPEMRAKGFELSPEVVSLGREVIARRNLASRVSVDVGGVASLPGLLRDAPGNVTVLTAFVLQELLEQSGREEIVRIMSYFFTHRPHGSWLVIEVDYRAADLGVMRHGLAQSYYNPYYLLHSVTEQRLETVSFWRAVFEESGAAIIQLIEPPQNVDTTGLAVGFLLRSRTSPC